MSTCSCFSTNDDTLKKECDDLAALFKALGHPSRVLIVQKLMHGELCVCDLHEGSGKDLSTISSHLTLLRHHGLITKEQRGKNIFYKLSCDCLPEVCRCLLTHTKN